jgi:hypothetical protein
MEPDEEDYFEWDDMTGETQAAARKLALKNYPLVGRGVVVVYPTHLADYVPAAAFPETSAAGLLECIARYDPETEGVALVAESYAGPAIYGIFRLGPSTD